MNLTPETQRKIHEMVARIKRNQAKISEDANGLTITQGSQEYRLLIQNGTAHSRSTFSS